MGPQELDAGAESSLPDTPRNEPPSPSLAHDCTDPVSLPVLHQKGKDKVDLRNLDYTKDVDENLVCPVCRVALVEPVTTVCDHVFCKDCLRHSYHLSPTCPIDRSPIRMPQDIRPTPKIILNQLDGLLVKCPNWEEGCQKVLARSMVQNHVSKYCEYVMIECPEGNCRLDVPRRFATDGSCRHQRVTCPDCSQLIWELKLERHRESDCEQRQTNCNDCGKDILRSRIGDHVRDCEEALTPCKWAEYGCLFTSKKKHMESHISSCDLRIMGPVMESMKQEITQLRGEIQFLSEKDKIKDRRIRFLECNASASHKSNPDLSTLPDTSPSAEYGPYDSRDQYLLSLLEHQDGKVDQLSAGITELEAKQTMMLFNETIPMKEQLAELRSAQGTLNMHVRWLLQFRRQESRPSAATNTGVTGTDSEGGLSISTIRRLSDSTRDNITKL